MAAVGLMLVAVIGLVVGKHDWHSDLGLPRPYSRACTVHADGEVTLNPEQMAHAATIAAIGMQRQMPERAVVVALATALQESKLENLAGGDRDSIGLFQQRPSQGWGTPDQVGDPRYAANKFYAALKKVRGWEKMRVTDAAQRVQRSAYPEAYQKWADESTVLTKALLGNATGAVACTVDGEPPMRGAAATEALGNGLRLDWGSMEASAQVTGLTVPAASPQAGWRYAHWLVSHATDHGVKKVRFAGLEWTAKEGAWAQIAQPDQAGQVVAEVYAAP
ncbi:hypothetical protein GCM10022251_21600 [Phytohabitans flavus]|uniref:Uncharacterized protein n=1 Tax=Phytohabitans flavus TaxID=1076124 RepID=A0A6F8Y073_9ACTN|nr:hypothetical protein Pflav_057780 [Phytohabitans flavus]